ncbi:MAG TPA: hypothetical protein VNL16_13410, partial [Chloroflexota bacterium]|nr:hypothetical protein [Chloroflexota bacterium]
VLEATVALLIPGFGPVAAWGILTVALESAALGAAAGGLVDGLTALDVSEDAARSCEDHPKRGRPIVVVRADGRTAQAQRILRGVGSIQRA